MGKSRVAPLKLVIVPKPELVAAVLASKLSATMCKELELNFSQVCFWTDASVILRYILNTSVIRFEVFITTRLEILHSLTDVAQWQYVEQK